MTPEQRAAALRLADELQRFDGPERESLRDEAAAEIERLRAALLLAVHAMRAPLDDWKGEVERKALDAARAALETR